MCRKHGVSDASIYKSKAKFGDLEALEAKRLKTLEDENTRQLADAMLDNTALKDVLKRNGDAPERAESCRASARSIRDERTASV